MSILPLLPILILLAGALAIVLSRAARFVRYDAIASVTSLLALATMIPLAIPQPQPLETLISTWQPLSVFGMPISLRVDPIDWPIGLAAVVACASTALAGFAYPGRRRFGPRALALGLTAALVTATFAANLLTLAIAWGLFDAFFAVAALARGEGAHAGRRAAFIVGFNGAATVCLWLAALTLNEAHQSQYWHLTELPESTRGILALAAVLRLGLYPFSQSLPAESDDAPGRVALLYVLPPLTGLHMLIRLADLNALPQGSALAWLAGLSVLIGGWMAWWRRQSRDALPYLALSALGVVVLSGINGHTTVAPPSVLASGAGSWALALMTLSLGRSFDPRRPWWAVSHALAFATLAGVPATLGFAVRTSLAAGLSASGDLLLIAVAVAGETLMFGALIRLATAPAQNEPPPNRTAILAYAAAVALAALSPFLLPALSHAAVPALTPPAFGVVLASLGALGGAIIALPIALAVGLEWWARDRFVDSFADPARFLGLAWLYGLIFRVADVVARAVRGLAALAEGEAAMLLALLILIAAYVALSGALG